MFNEIIVIVILIGINAFFAATEISVISLREIQLEKRASDGDKKAQKLISIIKEPSQFFATLQVGVTLASFLTSASAAVGLSKVLERSLNNSGVYLLVRYSPNISLITVTLGTSFLFLLFGELIPKRVALRYADKIAYNAIGTITSINLLIRPIANLLTFLTNFFVKLLFGPDDTTESQITEEEIRMMINVGEEKGIFRKMETDMINSIFEFDDTTVNDVMTPRPDIRALDVTSSFEETIKLIIDEKYSRIPVYKESIDDIIGIFYTKDIIDYIAFRKDKEKFDLQNFIKEPFFVTEYKKIDLLLREMQKKSVHISVVIDEYGTTAGIVTIEDMLEEIVGKIYDEYDVKEEEIKVKGENEFDVDGKVSMDELNELLEEEFPDNYDTISGLVLDYFGRFPRKGESTAIGQYVFTVTEVEHRRIKRILIKKNITKD